MAGTYCMCAFSWCHMLGTQLFINGRLWYVISTLFSGGLSSPSFESSLKEHFQDLGTWRKCMYLTLMLVNVSVERNQVPSRRMLVQLAPLPQADSTNSGLKVFGRNVVHWTCIEQTFYHCSLKIQNNNFHRFTMYLVITTNLEMIFMIIYGKIHTFFAILCKNLCSCRF